MKTNTSIRLGIALGLLGAIAPAQDVGFFSGIKLRGGFQAAARKDNLSAVLLGFGLEVGYEGSFGRIGAEAGFLYKPGRQYLHDLSTMPVTKPYQVDPNWSKDSRKNQADGFAVRVAYEFPLENFGLRAGIQLGGTKFRQEYIADVTDGANFEDTYNGVHSKGGMAVSPFLGISLPVARNQFFELQVLGLSYTAIDYVHVAGTDTSVWGANSIASDYVKESKRFVPHIEVAYGFRF